MSSVASITTSVGLKERGAISGILNCTTVATQTLHLLGRPSSCAIPWVSLFISPLALYHFGKKTKNLFSLARISKCVTDKVFWAVKGVSNIGQVASSIVQPFVCSFTLAGVSLSSAATLVFQRIIPHFVLAMSAIGLVSASWSLKRTIYDYKHEFKKINHENVKEILQDLKNKYPLEKKVRFYSSYFVSDNDFRFLDHLDERQSVQALKRGAHFNVYKRCNAIAISVITILAASLLIASGQYYIIAIALIVSGAGLSISEIFVKNIMIQKYHDMIKSRTCPKKKRLLESYISPDLSTTQA